MRQIFKTFSLRFYIMTFKYGVWCKIGTYLSFALTIGNIYLCTSVNLALLRVWQAISNLIGGFFFY